MFVKFTNNKCSHEDATNSGLQTRLVKQILDHGDLLFKGLNEAFLAYYSIRSNMRMQETRKATRSPAIVRDNKVEGSGALPIKKLDIGLLKISFYFEGGSKPARPYPNPFPNLAWQS